jgi:ribosomal protein S18 acetylase RimI-like enzyme
MDMPLSATTIIARRNGVILRQAADGDLPRVDEIVISCYEPIYESYISIVGEDIYRGIRRNPDVDWSHEKTGRVRKIFREHPGCMWVLEDAGVVFGFLAFVLFPDQSRLWIEENGLISERRGQGWATFMLRHLLTHARNLGIRFASVEVDLDDVHIPARRAYQAVGFDRHHHIAIYHQDLDQANPGSTLDDGGSESARG